jgi:hypothetical protein
LEQAFRENDSAANTNMEFLGWIEKINGGFAARITRLGGIPDL